MPNCHWYGTAKDHHTILSLIIAQDNVDVMELYAANNQPIKTFDTPQTALAQAKFGALHLNLWHRTASPRCEITRSQRNDGTWFERTGAMGFVQFYLAFVQGERLHCSQTNTPSPARVGATDGIFHDATGAPWDVGLVNRYSAWLNRQIKKMAVARYANVSVLPGAAHHWHDGGAFGFLNQTQTTHASLYVPLD